MSTNTAKILVIEDSLGDVLLLRFALDHHKENYVLELLRDGEEAIRFIEAQRSVAAPDPEPCVIVLDLNLPKYDGASVLQALKREPTLAHIQVVALSGVANPSDARKLERLGVRLLRTKPMKLEDWIELASEIIAICREPVAA
jgi:CheY-like chemotaxis protein